MLSTSAFYYYVTLCISAVLDIGWCPYSVCPSVCPSVRLMYCIKMAENIIRLFSHPGSPISLVFSPSGSYRILMEPHRP